MLISAWNPYDDNITSPAPQPISIKGRSMKRIVRTLTIESSGGSRLTYEKGLLNSRKNGHFCKTNQPDFPAPIRQSPPLAKANGKPTKPIVRNLRVKCTGGNKTNQPCFPHTLPHYPLHVFARHEVPKQSPWGCRRHKAPYFARNENMITSMQLVYLYWLKRVIDASSDTDTMAIRRDTHVKN